jgi:hypothetical protein
MNTRRPLFQFVPALFALALHGCGGGGGGGDSPPNNPNPPVAAWSEPEALATAQGVSRADIGIVRADPDGGVLLSWSSYMPYATRHGFVEKSLETEGKVSELPDVSLLTGWAWDASGPSAAIGARDPVNLKPA